MIEHHVLAEIIIAVDFKPIADCNSIELCCFSYMFAPSCALERREI